MKVALNPDLFVIPDGGDFLLFLPLDQRVHIVDRESIRFLQRVASVPGSLEPGGVAEAKTNELLDLGIAVERAHIRGGALSPSSAESYSPTQVIFALTGDCNLRCTYCYASAGTNKECLTLAKALAALRFARDNAVRQASGSMNVSFHGGGEPFTQFGLMKQVVQSAREMCVGTGLNLGVSVTTNGVLSDAMLGWLHLNVASVSLSVDGPPDVQLVQRPLVNGGSSSRHVERTIRFFEEHGVAYGIRITVTQRSLPRLTRIVDYFAETTSRKTLHLEPVSETGRCGSSGEQAPSPDDFLAAFRAAQQHARSRGIELTVAGVNIRKPGCTFCGAAGKNFLVTPSGDISTCVEVTERSDAMSEIFFVGRVDEAGRVNVDEAKVDVLRSRTVDNVEGCGNCYAKYACAGDCPVKVARNSGTIFRVDDSSRCTINRALVLDEVKRTLTAKRTCGEAAL